MEGSLNSRLESNKEEEEELRVMYQDLRARALRLRVLGR